MAGLDLIRGHWGGVEVRNHWRRDALMGEDGSRSRHSRLLANVALIRNAMLQVMSDALEEQLLPQLRESLPSRPMSGPSRTLMSSKRKTLGQDDTNDTYRYYSIAKAIPQSYAAVVMLGKTQRARQLLRFRTGWVSGVASIIVALALSDDAPANEPTDGAQIWSMFRGEPQLLGVATGSLNKELTLLWNHKTGGPVKSSPAVVEDRVFVGSSDQHVYSVEVVSGKRLWAFKTGGEVESSPLVLDGRVFVGSSDGWFYALKAESGVLAWKFQTGDKILSSANWLRSPNGHGTWLVVGSYDNRLYCLDAATGKSNWVYETGNYINGSPAVAGGQTVFGGCDAILHVLSLTNGAKVKEIEAGAYIAASVALEGNRAFFGHYENEFLCIDIAKGTNLWTYKDRGFPYFSSPAITRDRVIFGGRDKRLHCVEKETGKAIWDFATRGKVDSSPVVVGDKVVVGSDDGRLYMIALKDGAELWSYEIGQPISSSPAIVGGKVVVGSDDGSIYCFGPKKDAPR